MTPKSYRQELEAAADRIRSRVEHVCISGLGPGQFLVAEFAGRSVEIHRGDDDICIDLAVGDELLGDVSFATYDDAIVAALHGSSTPVAPPNAGHCAR